VRRGAVAVVVCAAAAVLAAPPATAAAGDEPARLWSAFPLEHERAQPKQAPTSARRARVPARPAPSTTDGSAPLGPIVAAAVGGGLLLAVLIGVWPGRRRNRPIAQVQPKGEVRQLAIQATECNKLSPTLFPQRSPFVSAQPQQTRPETTSEPRADEAAAKPYADIGERVAGVLAAAEQAAAQIKSDAEEQAAALRRRAEEEASARVEQAKQDAEKTRAEAERDVRETREAVDSYASQRRREAEEQSQRMLAEAETEARAVREAAEQMAARIEDTAKRRQEAVREETRLVEARMQRALEGFRQMTARLEELLETPEAEESETLVEALDVDRRRQPTA
jgi:hypothetical protein